MQGQIKHAFRTESIEGAGREKTASHNFQQRQNDYTEDSCICIII